jgi:hypothetical protein
VQWCGKDRQAKVPSGDEAFDGIAKVIRGWSLRHSRQNPCTTWRMAMLQAVDISRIDELAAI